MVCPMNIKGKPLSNVQCTNPIHTCGRGVWMYPRVHRPHSFSGFFNWHLIMICGLFIRLISTFIVPGVYIKRSMEL